MRIAILGTRGIPAHYGGFETFAEELSTRLVLGGHQVTVYCREPYPDDTGAASVCVSCRRSATSTWKLFTTPSFPPWTCCATVTT